MDTKPPISRAKMISITKSAIKAMKVRMVWVILFMFLTSKLVVEFVQTTIPDCFAMTVNKSNLTCLLLSQLYKHVVQIVEKFIRKVNQIIFVITYCTLAPSYIQIPSNLLYNSYLISSF